MILDEITTKALIKELAKRWSMPTYRDIQETGELSDPLLEMLSEAFDSYADYLKECEE